MGWAIVQGRITVFQAQLEAQNLMGTHGTTLKEAWLMWLDSESGG